MLDQLTTFLRDQLTHNQFLAGGFVLGILATVLHHCKALPQKWWSWFKSLWFVSVELNERDESFMWMVKWLAAHPYGNKRARRLAAITERPEDSERDPRPRIILSPAKGQHWFVYKGRLFFLNRYRPEGGGGEDGPIKAGKKENWLAPEVIEIRTFGRRREAIKHLLEDAREIVHPTGERRTALLQYNYGGWQTKRLRRPRPVESIILRNGLLEDIIAQIEEFRRSEDWYVERGIPYRLGILLSGPPGSGKSSTICGVASHFNMDLGIASLSSSRYGDDDLMSMMADVPKNTMLMIEDVDCSFNQRAKTDDDESKISFSGLLNALDGAAAGEGRILWMTTNFPERLDPALIRPGRADLHYEIGQPDSSQVCRMFNRFYPQASDSQTLRFVEAVRHPEETSMAALQGHLLRYKHDPEAAIRHAAAVYRDRVEV